MAEKSAGASATSSSAQNLGPEEQFLAILNNRGKTDPGAGPTRDRGFVVVAEGTPSLQFLQSLCHSDEQTYNTCLTARYRLGLGPVLGTLFDCLVSDLRELGRRRSREAPPRDLLGDLLPPPGPDPRDTAWRQVTTLAELLVPLQDVEPWTDVVSPRDIETVLTRLARALNPGDRFVLFCELPEHGIEAVAADAQEWSTVLDEAGASFLSDLPERVGIVFGFPDDGYPSGFSMVGPEHQARLSFSGTAAAVSENVQRFKPAALAGDYAATRDVFGLQEEARAIARLILHPQTDPMTISVEAPWGQGKSSFLNFVGRGLTEVAAQRVDPRLGTRLNVWEEASSALERQRIQLTRSGESESDEGREEREAGIRALEEASLRSEEKQQQAWARMDRAAQREVLQVRFNAWRHQDATHIWAGLVSEVSKAVEKSLPRWRRWIAPLTYAFRNRASELFVRIVLPTILAVVVALTLTFFGASADSQELDDVPTIFKVLVPGSAVVAVLAWRVYRVLQPVSQRVLDYVRLPDYRDQLGFQEQVVRDLAYLRKLLRRRRFVRRDRLLPSREARDPRIVVFIDDLDRCPDDKVMEVLQTVNLVLVQGGGADAGGGGSHGAFVLLAVDTDKIHQAIEHHYEKQGASTADPEFAQSYLRKIIQLPYYLPEPAQGRRLSLIQESFTLTARALLEEADEPAAAGAETRVERELEGFRIARDAVLRPRVQVFSEVEDTPAELRTFGALAEFLPDNPREMKRLLNVHRFVKILLQRPETPPDDVAQRKLVAWLIFCARWEGCVDPLVDFANRDGRNSSRDCLEALEEVEPSVAPFRKKLVDELEITLTAEDLSRDGILAEAAMRTRVLPRSPAG